MKKFEGKYTLIDTSTTHNQILYRLVKPDGNVDILFEGVKKMKLPFTLLNPSINVIDIPEVNGIIVTINCEDGDYEVNAERVLTQCNKLKGEETSIPSKLDVEVDDDFINNLVAETKQKGLDSLFDKFKDNDWEVIRPSS